MEGSKTRFRVTCEDSCENVKLQLKVDSGDPDLFAFDELEPTLNDYNTCETCASFCSSRRGASEYCDISTKQNQFYVLVYGISDYGNGNITFENVLRVETYGNVYIKIYLFTIK